MPSYKDFFPDKWLTSDHLKGKVVTITISKVTVEQMYNSLTRQNEGRLAASFVGRAIMLPLNKTQVKAMEAITGTDDYERWRDVRVTLAPARAHNGKGTIVIAAAPPAQAKPVAAAPQDTLVHGRDEPTLVHGRPVPALEPEVDFTPVHGPQDDGDYDPEEEERPVEADPKSGGADPEPGAEDADDLFFSPSDLQNKVRSLHVASTEPMTLQQHTYITRILHDFCGKPAEMILSELIGRAVDTANPAGASVGRYLYDLLRNEGPLPHETSALRDYCQRIQVAVA